MDCFLFLHIDVIISCNEMRRGKFYLYNMLSYQDAFFQLKRSLFGIYDVSEATAIAHEVLEHITGLSKLQRLSDKGTLFTKEQQKQFEDAARKLSEGMPLQYITGVQWFLGKPFHVSRQVLIPRPETEELVQWIIDEWKDKNNVSIFDIGTGSGCIPITLKLKMPNATIMSCDISEEALVVARQNAVHLKADVSFKELDFLNTQNWHQLELFDVIVSNPPYIPLSEKESLDKNVRDHEPATALFVPDALLFYRQIASFGKAHLQADGSIYCELHRDYAIETKALFEEMNYSSVTLKKDMHGNDRMLKAIM